MITDPRASFTERLQTFEGYWGKYTVTSRQLAALGHVFDRPPLEALEYGSRCITCSKFIPRWQSIRALQNELDYEGSAGLEFHEKGCERLQVRLPYSTDPRLDSLPSYTIKDTVRRFRSRSSTSSINTIDNYKHSPLLRLPVEIRLEIYEYLLPYSELVTNIVPIDRYSVQSQVRGVVSLDEQSTRTGDLPPCPATIYGTAIALLSSCSTINAECMEMLFQSTTFRFENSRALYLWLRQIGHRGRRALISVDVTCGYRDDAMCFALLACCKSLRSLTLRRCCLFSTGPVNPLWFEEGVSCLMDISGLKKVVFQEYLEPEGASDDKPAVRRLREQLTRLPDQPVYEPEDS